MLIGVETADMIASRQKQIDNATDQGGDTPALYQVLPEKKITMGGAMMEAMSTVSIVA